MGFFTAAILRALPGTRCTWLQCGRRASTHFVWQHRHRGVSKTAKRNRCPDHARLLARKLGLEMPAW